MALSRKHQRELKRLRAQAEDLWEDQRDVLEHAAKVVRDAGRQAGRYANDEVAPRVRDVYEDGVRFARSTARSAGDRFQNDVVPAVTGALGSALAAIEVVKNRQVRDVIKNAGRLGNDVGTKLGIVKPKPSFGPGKYILIGIGVVALAGIAYAAWQTLRADDDLWVDDEPAPSQDFDESEA